jgi:hypothetical protein
MACSAQPVLNLATGSRTYQNSSMKPWSVAHCSMIAWRSVSSRLRSRRPDAPTVGPVTGAVLMVVFGFGMVCVGVLGLAAVGLLLLAAAALL